MTSPGTGRIRLGRFGNYGMLGVLLLLSLFFSILTVRPQDPVGGAGESVPAGAPLPRLDEAGGREVPQDAAEERLPLKHPRTRARASRP